RRDEGVVGRLEMGGIVPVEVSGGPCDQQRREADRREEWMAAEPALARLFAGLALLRDRLRLGGLGRTLGGALGLLGAPRRALSRGLCRGGLARRRAQRDNVPLRTRRP